MKALELADELESRGKWIRGNYEKPMVDAAAELRRLAAVESDCAQYLKEGETPAERIKRALGDADSLLTLYRDVIAERDALKAENERLTNCLKKSNDQAEDFERRWYLADMELERIKALEPVMIYHGACTIDCGEHGHHHTEMLKMIPAGTELYALGSKT